MICHFLSLTMTYSLNKREVTSSSTHKVMPVRDFLHQPRPPHQKDCVNAVHVQNHVIYVTIIANTNKKRYEKSRTNLLGPPSSASLEDMATPFQMIGGAIYAAQYSVHIIFLLVPSILQIFLRRKKMLCLMMVI